MITETDRAQIFHTKLRGFLYIDHRQAETDREDRVYQWLAPAMAGHRWPRDHCERFLHENVPAGSPWLRDQFADCIIIQAPICACCGPVGFYELQCVRPDPDPTKREYRCEKHRDRNPCCVEGCKRTRVANGHLSNDVVICGEHFRRFVPPGSAERRALHRLARLAKKLGYARNQVWPADLEDRYWRVWRGIVRRIRRQATEGRLDEAEINRMFGWEDEAA